MLLTFTVSLTWALAVALFWLPTSVSSFAPLSFGGRARQREQFSEISSSILSKTQRSPLLPLYEASRDSSFSLSNLFGGGGSKTANSSPNAATSTSSVTASLRGRKALEPHPSVRPHISPLNRLFNDPNRRKQPSRPITSDMLPVHPDVRSGVLENGLPYIILPNKSPPGRFEAHLQVFSGSADELEPQQGIAHLTEHVAYMGSRKRERLFGTGSQSELHHRCSSSFLVSE